MPSLREAIHWYRENRDKFYSDTVIAPTAEGGRWIQGAIRNPGALRATATRAGAITQRGTIDVGWLHKMAAGTGKTAQRARLALTLRSFH